MIKRLSKEKIKAIPDEGLHIVGLWNLMVILIPFLLLSATVSQTSILNLYIPTTISEPKGESVQSTLLIVSIIQKGFRVQKGDIILPLIEKRGEFYDFEGLSSTLYDIKEELGLQEQIVLLSGPDIPYEVLVGVMDRSRERIILKEGVPQAIPLFPNISIGSAVE